MSILDSLPQPAYTLVDISTGRVPEPITSYGVCTPERAAAIKQAAAELSDVIFANVSTVDFTNAKKTADFADKMSRDEKRFGVRPASRLPRTAEQVIADVVLPSLAKGLQGVMISTPNADIPLDALWTRADELTAQRP